MKKWQRKEREDAKDLGGRVTPRSGGLWSFAGDVTTDEFLVDSKQTDKKSYSVKTSVWDKVYKEALMARKTPLLSLQIEDLDLIVIDKNDFIDLLDKARKTPSNSRVQ